MRIVGAALLLAGLAASATPTGCAGGSAWTQCTSNGGDHVVVGDSRGWESEARTASEARTGDSSRPSRRRAPHDPLRREAQLPDRCANRTSSVDVPCDPGREAEPDAAAIPAVRVADLASFAPAAPAVASDPAGVGLVGAPTNLVARAGKQSLDGALLGRPVTVTFTPTSFAFDHGDGTRATTSTGGASWAALGQPDFTPTATSHTYRAPDTYGVVVTVAYTADVDFGGGVAQRVDGLVERAAPPYAIRVVRASTGLVARTCAEDPRGPGC